MKISLFVLSTTLLFLVACAAPPPNQVTPQPNNTEESTSSSPLPSPEESMVSKSVSPITPNAEATNTPIASISTSDSADFVLIETEKPFELSIGQMARFEDKFELTFVSVEQDSRCPPDVDCVWEGEVSVLLTKKDSSAKEELTLSSVRNKTASLDKYTIELTAVEPPPAKSTAKINDKLYVITLVIK